MSTAATIANALIAMNKDGTVEQVQELIHGKARIADHPEILARIDGHQSSNETNAVLIAQALLGDASACARLRHLAPTPAKDHLEARKAKVVEHYGKAFNGFYISGAGNLCLQVWVGCTHTDNMTLDQAEERIERWNRLFAS
jgi:hypothetical protein